jgi:hypothetical protein
MDADPKLLEELVMSDEIDKVFELVSTEEAARAWCSYNVREHPQDEEDDPDWWAVHLMMEVRPERRRREMLALLVEFAPNDDVLGVVGAGPLEDFIPGEGDWLSWIEAQAAASEKFRTALANAWVADDVTRETFARLERAAGVKLRTPLA